MTSLPGYVYRFVVIPAKAGIRGGEGRSVRQTAPVTLAMITHVRSFPLSGNVCNKPLDSSAFVPDTALPPASMQAGLRRNDAVRGSHDN